MDNPHYEAGCSNHHKLMFSLAFELGGKNSGKGKSMIYVHLKCFQCQQEGNFFVDVSQLFDAVFQ